MKEKLMVQFARNVGGRFAKVVKEKLVPSRRFVLFVPNVGRNGGDDKEGELRPKFQWPHVMTPSVAKEGSLISGTWIWHHQHVRWHHGYYRTRR